MISGVLAGGTRENLPLDLKPGRYALLCFASDRAGGPPHVAKGMLDEVTVARADARGCRHVGEHGRRQHAFRLDASCVDDRRFILTVGNVIS
jgi:hypothetical protein